MSAGSDSPGDRASGALVGLAVGDALGMPTQDMSRQHIAEDYGLITSVLPAGPRQVIAAGRPAGAVTDDTEQALLVARLLIEGGGYLDPTVFADELMSWERSMAAKGSLDLLGPSTKLALERIAAGISPEEAGRFGATNGAAMRITPVGIAVAPEPLEPLVAAVIAASRVTHNTSIGLAAAAAVAAAVSVGVEGGGLDSALSSAIAAADLAERSGHWVAGGRIGPRIAWATAHLRSVPPDRWADEIDAVIGTGVAAQESVVAAFAIVAVVPSPWESVCLAASVGGDTDTIAAIVGAITGAIGGSSAWPAPVVRQVEQVNQLDLAPVADALLQLRHP